VPQVGGLAKRGELLSTGEVASRVGVTRTTVLHWIKSGKLPAAFTTAGGHYRITEADLTRFLSERHSANEGGIRNVILIVDDEPAILDVVQRALRPSFPGWRIETASDGVDAGMKLLRLTPALLVLDLMLPGIDGFEVCRLVRSDPQLRKTAILCITGYKHPGVYEQALEAGADDCLFKPLDLQTLRQKAQELIARPR